MIQRAKKPERKKKEVFPDEFDLRWNDSPKTGIVNRDSSERQRSESYLRKLGNYTEMRLASA